MVDGRLRVRPSGCRRQSVSLRSAVFRRVHVVPQFVGGEPSVILRYAKAPQKGFAHKDCAIAQVGGLEAEVGGGVRLVAVGFRLGFGGAGHVGETAMVRILAMRSKPDLQLEQEATGRGK